MKHIVFTVTNDLSFDQRMKRICASLANAGYKVLLVGRQLADSPALRKELFHQKRINCFFNKKFLFYAEYNLRLFFFLLFAKMDAVCAIDLDTILPCYFASLVRGKKRVYDAHELFTEMKEVLNRPRVKKIWSRIERFSVPKFKSGYTVSCSIAEEFARRYQVNYAVIRNLPLKKALDETKSMKKKLIVYQGAVNEARGLEPLVKAMVNVDAPLYMYGTGNIFNKIEKLIHQNKLQDKVILKGRALPDDLDSITREAYFGINLVEPAGLNQLYSLSNKFFDYIQAGIPQVTMSFPEYKKINEQYEVALLAETIGIKEIENKLNFLLNEPAVYDKLKANCMAAREVFNWQQEEPKLLEFYNNLFSK